MNKNTDSGLPPARPTFVLGALVFLVGWFVILKNVSAML